MPSAANAEHYARIVRDHALKREIISAAHRMVREAHESVHIVERGDALWEIARA